MITGSDTHHEGEWMFSDRQKLPCETLGVFACAAGAPCVCVGLGFDPAVSGEYDPTGTVLNMPLGESPRILLTDDEAARVTEVKQLWHTQPSGWMPGPALLLREHVKLQAQVDALHRAVDTNPNVIILDNI